MVPTELRKMFEKLPKPPRVLRARWNVDRRESGLTQHQLAEKANIPIQTIRRLKHGTANLASWGRVLGVLGLELHGRTLPSGGTLGEQLALLRKRRGISQRELCSLIGVTQPNLIALERKCQGRLATLERVTVALGARLYLAPTGQIHAFYSHTATSSLHHGWHTPVALLDALYSVFGIFDLDPCSPTNNRRKAPVRARTCFTLGDDGLMLPWRGTVLELKGRTLSLSKTRNPLNQELSNGKTSYGCGNRRSVFGNCDCSNDNRTATPRWTDGSPMSRWLEGWHAVDQRSVRSSLR